MENIFTKDLLKSLSSDTDDIPWHQGKKETLQVVSGLPECSDATF